MAARSFFSPVVNSITAKISLVILVIETVLLGCMGVYYYNHFSGEIDTRVEEKLRQTAELMSQLALNFEAVTELGTLEELIEEDVVDAFIVDNNGAIVYAAGNMRDGDHFAGHLDRAENHRISAGAGAVQFSRFSIPGEGPFISSFAPLAVKGNRLGFLYLKIRAGDIERRKRAVVYLFLVGSLVTILLTTLIEALWVHHLFVPRIRETVSSLGQVEEGNFATRVSRAGMPDQIGTLIGSVNSMISRVESYTRNLQGLAGAGEDLAEAGTVADVYIILMKILETHFRIDSSETCLFNATGDDSRGCRSFRLLDPMERKLVTNGEILLTIAGAEDVSSSPSPGNPPNARLFIPVLDGGKPIEIISLSIRFPAGQRLESSEVFIRTLSRLTANAVRRTEALGELRHAEKRYRDLFTQAVEGIFHNTPDGRTVAANPALAAMMGYSTPEELLENITDLASQVYANPEERQHLLARIQADGMVRDFQVRLRRRNGEIFWASLWAHSITNRQGEMTGLSGSVVDISERKRIEEESEKRRAAEAAHEAKSELLTVLEMKNRALQEALDDLRKTQSRLVQSEKMAVIGTMAGGVAHDLNNILAGVLSYPDLLLMQLPPDSGLRESIEVIRDSGAKAAAVVADLLTMSRSAAYNTVIFDINGLVEKHLSSPEFRELSSRYPGVRIETRLEDGLRLVMCSPVHIEKAIMNLTVNAVEAVGGTGTVAIGTENVDVKDGDDLSERLAPGEYVAIRVSDSGPGIAAGDLERVFEPFFSRKVLGRSGTGLGLAVVWNTVREHLGFVVAASGDEGTVLSVYLPASREALEPPPAPTASLEQMKSTGTVLVVDDERTPRQIAARMLKALGYRADTVSSGEEAIAYLKKHTVDFVLLDMIMDPGMSGFETFREIVEIRPGQRAVITSGYTEHHDLAKAVELGVRGFLRKPFTTAQLADAIRRAGEDPA